MPSYPAGLSTDSLELHQAAVSSPPTQDDQWSDAHDTIETDYERDVIEEEEVEEDTEDLTVQGPKVSSDKTHTHDIDTPSPTQLDSSTAQERASDLDATSVHSMPVVQVTESTSSMLPSTPRSVHSHFSAATSPSHTSLAPPAQSTQNWRRRHRTALDTRASSRFSGFLSNLIHRRDNHPSPAPESNPPATPPVNVNQSSRASSPIPPRPSTPPPQLPPPSLVDLGLSLSPLTDHLSPSHFTSPPTSGAFLAPHYLLLCHAQGLDVLPLISPPTPQPYALVRRAPFKSVVVMEHRGVLVAIAGRRDGVRVYALEEIRRMVEWRMEVEVRRERERARREETKRTTAITLVHYDGVEKRGSTEKQPAIIPSAIANDKKPIQFRRSSVSVVPPGQPRPPVVRAIRPKTPPARPTPSEPIGPPPAYSSLPPREREWEREQPVPPPLPHTRTRATSVSEVLAGTLSRRHTMTSMNGENENREDSKGDWASSDDEAIDVMAAPSGSQLLDERTSAMAAASTTIVPSSGTNGRVEIPRSQTVPTLNGRGSRRSRPANLDLSLTRANTTNVIPVPPPSPTPTLLTLRQALSLNAHVGGEDGTMSPEMDGDADGEEDEDGEPAASSPTTPTRERITLAEALFESRLPDVPPAGSRREQEPILINSHLDGEAPASPRTSESHSTFIRQSRGEPSMSIRRRRRWSVLGGVFSNPSGQSQSSIPSLSELSQAAMPEPADAPEMRERRPNVLTRSHSGRIPPSASDSTVTVRTRRPSTSPGSSSTAPASQSSTDVVPPPLPQPTSSGASHSRFLPRILTNALARRSDDVPQSYRTAGSGSEKPVHLPPPPHAPAPKLEYVKLPGTKGAVSVKAVETAKKSFLAILCGDNGEKVELFAGTYRTALGLSRTFILPDSPRSLELQLQGDDLVEVFLVFSQNVFGLEPATVRVREVRIGRAERRAARRRARENASGHTPEGETDNAPAGGEEEGSINVTIGIAVTPPLGEEHPPATASSEVASPQSESTTQLPIDSTIRNANSISTDELVTLAAAQMSPYTTFQQLLFSPNFPLATIADEYIIPPTYRSFIEYRNQYEPEVEGSANVDLSQVQFSPPGLPVPTPAPPSKWFYRDPKGIVHGPWKASLMQAWYRDGLLPPDLPVKREEDTDYTILKDLRLQCVDPTHPFRSSAPTPAAHPPVPVPDSSKPLLPPQSLLSQPKHFGPPALFYSSRGGHSTTIVDSRGRSVLKGRFMWSSDDITEESRSNGRLGDVKRLEAFDVQDRAVLVAMRQGGLEAVDFGDALLKPADYSRTLLPHFHPPSSSTNRRGPFVWKIGTPLDTSGLTPVPITLPMMTRTGMVPKKKQSTGPSKSPGRAEFMTDGDGEYHDEVIYLGRKDNDMYLCERSSTTFRVLKLSPAS